MVLSSLNSAVNLDIDLEGLEAIQQNLMGMNGCSFFDVKRGFDEVKATYQANGKR